MKPISTVPAALPSVHLGSLELVPAHVERSERQLRSTVSIFMPAWGTCLAIASRYLASSTTESSSTTL